MMRLLRIFVRRYTATSRGLRLSTRIFASFHRGRIIRRTRRQFRRRSSAASLIFSTISIVSMDCFRNGIRRANCVLTLNASALFSVLFRVLNRYQSTRSRMKLRLFSISQGILWYFRPYPSSLCYYCKYSFQRRSVRASRVHRAVIR